MKDPIVQEVRLARTTHAKKFKYDLSAICADLRNIEKRCGHRLVSRNPNLILQKPATKRSLIVNH
jgi:hypothetical protein